MNKRSILRAISLFLSASMLLSITTLLTSCDNKTTGSDSEWAITEKDTVISLDVEIKDDGAQRSLVVTSPDSVFESEIKENMIKIFGYNNVTSEDSTSQSDADTSQTSSSESTAENQANKNELSGFSVSVDSDKQLTIKLSESDSKYWGYMVAVHSSATKSNNFAEGWVFETTTEELVTYSAELSGEYTAGTENPVITV